MAKKAKQQQLDPEWSPEEEIPEDIAEAADEYDVAYTKKTKALAALNSAKEAVIDLMKERGIKSVPIRNGAKRLTLKDGYSLKIEKPMKQPKEAVAN